MRPSAAGTGTHLDDAYSQSFLALGEAPSLRPLKKEFSHQAVSASREEARSAVSEFVNLGQQKTLGFFIC